MNHANRLRPRPLTPFIVADALASATAQPATAATQAGLSQGVPQRADKALARPARALPCRPGELVCASPA